MEVVVGYYFRCTTGYYPKDHSISCGEYNRYRFHGRNIKNWLRKEIDTSLRYDYDEYNEIKLRGFAGDIKTLKNKVKKVFAMSNNHRGSKAIRNTISLKRIFDN